VRTWPHARCLHMLKDALVKPVGLESVLFTDRKKN